MRRTHEDMLAEIEQHTGKTYPGTNMVILGYAGRNERGQIIVKCKSDSRGEFIAKWNEIKRGNTKGTVRGELHIRRNEYDVCDNTVKVHLKSGKYFVCDIQDISLVKNFTWYLNQNGYARSSDGLYFHRLVTSAPENYIVDHINGNKLDNRKSNLRICTSMDNSHNMKIFKTNTSGHTGVCKTKSGKYEASIVANYKHIYLGVYDDFDNACEAYNAAKEKYHNIDVGIDIEGGDV